MHNTNDDILINYRPDSLQEDNYIADIKAIIENRVYHSDEVSETDDEKTQDEVSRHIWPKNKNESDHHVIRVYDKPYHKVFDRAYHVSIYAKCRSMPKNVKIRTLCQPTPFK